MSAAGVDGDDAGAALRARRVDPRDARVRVRAAQDRGVHHAGQHDVVGVGARCRSSAADLHGGGCRSRRLCALMAVPINARGASRTERTMFW